MGATVRPETSDPLAGYSPDWRTRAGASASDPLSGYSPDWRRRVGPLRAPRAPQTAPTGEIAPADATARIAGMPTTNLYARRLTGPAKLASDVFEAGADAISHPLGTAAGIVTAPLRAAATLGRYAGQQAQPLAVRALTGDAMQHPVHDVSGREALEAGAQLGAMALAGPAEGALERVAGGTAAKVLTGAGVGATFTPESPAVGAVLGAAAGGAAQRMGRLRVPGGTPEDVRARRVADMAETIRAQGPDARMALDLARANAIDAGDMATERLLREVATTHDAMPRPPVSGRPDTPPSAMPGLPDAPASPPSEPAPSSTSPVEARPAAEAPAVAPEPIAAPEPTPEPTPEPAADERPYWVFRDPARFRADGNPVVQIIHEYGNPEPGHAGAVDVSGYRTRDGRHVHLGANMDDLRPALPEEVAAMQSAASGTKGASDLFGNPVASTEPAQGALFGARAGTDASRSLAQTEAAARGELPALRERLARTTDPAERQHVAERVATMERLVNRDEAIGANEMAARAATEPPHDNARTPGGKLRPVEQVATSALLDEYESLMARMERDGKLAAYRFPTDDSNHATTNIGGTVMASTRTARGTSQQAEAARRLRQAQGVVDRMDAEFSRRGIDVWTELEDRRAARDEREGMRGVVGPRSFAAVAPDGFNLFANPVGPALKTTARLASRGVHAVLDTDVAKNFTDAFNRVVDPAARSPEAGRAATTLRAQTGEMARSYEQAEAALHAGSRAFDRMPEAERLAFIDRVETGAQQPTPELQGVHDAIRRHLDTTRDAIIAETGKLTHFIQDYLPHIWTDPAKAQQVFASFGGKRPMEGGKSFLKQRTIPTTADGIAAGLTPVTTNPVDLTLLKLREMQRYLMAQRTLAEMKTKGLVQYVRAGQAPPQGYVRIDDRIAIVSGPRQGAVSLPQGANVAPNAVTVHGQRIMGQYYAPEPVALVVNNYLSPGLRGNALFDAYRGIGNALNQAQLGLSAFHVGMTSLDAAVSRVALGIEQVVHGKPLAALRTAASAPVAPVTNIVRGARIRRAYLNPAGASAADAAVAQMVAEAGGRVRQDSFYGTAAKDFRQALRDKRYARAGVKVLPALLEKTMAPVMEFVVPRQKLGVFADLARETVDHLPPGASQDEVRAALAKVWDSVDNRMGQLVYDNLFWNKTVKDLAMATTRSVGWNLGTLRELGGGALDYARAADALAQGKHPEFTRRMAYTAALPLTVGTLGAVMNYVMTGEGPQELKDYFFPRTGTFDADGNANRVQLPSYMKDVFAYVGAPWQTVKHKLAPVLSMMGEMLENEDFYGDQIRNTDDPLVQQLLQEAQFMGRTAIPFAVQNMREGAQRGESAGERAAAFVGVTPAPRSRVRSPAGNKLAEYAGAGPSGATQEEAATRKARQAVLGALRGQGDADRAITQAVDVGALTPAQFERIRTRATLTPMQERFKALPLEKAMRVFDLADDREKALLAELLQAKIDAASKSPP